MDRPKLLKEPDNTYKMYFQVKSNKTDNPYYIYLATTDQTSLAAIADGDEDNDFTLAGNTPVLSPSTTSTDWDGFRVMQPMAVKDGSSYYMWYVGYNSSGHQAKIGFAFSSDGISWTKGHGNPILAGASTPNVWTPFVLKVGSTYHMWNVTSGIQYISANAPIQFSTIQAAIDAASPSDNINVTAGVYAEQLTVNKSLTLQGTGSPTINVSSYADYGVNVTAPNVTIDGFEFIGLPINPDINWRLYTLSDIWPTIKASAGANGLVVSNNVFNTGKGEIGHEALLIVSDVNNVEFTDNQVNNYCQGVGTWLDVDNLLVDNNTFNIAVAGNGINPGENSKQIAVRVGWAVFHLFGDGLTMTNNVINGPGPDFYNQNWSDKDMVLVFAERDAIGSLHSQEQPYNETATITITGNEMKGLYVGIHTSADGGTISNNNIHNNLIGLQLAQVNGTWIRAPTAEFSITGNDIKNNKGGIWIHSTWIENPTLDGIAIHYNNIVGNDVCGIENDIEKTLNATNNWWGNTSGPYNAMTNPYSRGDQVSTNVTYRPWSHWKGQSGAETAIGTVSDVSASFDATAKTDTEVDLSELGTGASGSITVAKYPATPSTATTLADDTGKTALKYVDVQVGNLTQGNASIKVHYTDTGGLKESSLRLYYWTESSWVESSSSSVDTTNNYVQGTIPVDKLTGTQIAVGGSPPPAPPTPVPEFSPIGLLAFIGILSVVLAVATLRKRE